ncbi:MAG TPA: TonB family protein [Chitinophagales bacterium]|nr:TonB family protein [Chitinophagales bacterium]
MPTNYQNTRMLDMVFENRNKNYGAYVLRNDYSNRMSRALLITFTALALLALGKVAADKFNSGPSKMIGPIVTIDIGEEIHLEKEIEIEKPKPPVENIPEPQGINAARDVEMNVVASNNLVDSFLTNEEKSDVEAGVTTNLTDNTMGVTDAHGRVETFQVTAVAPVEPPKVWIAVEKMPEFPGGEEALMRFLSKNTGYPEYERDLEIQGKAVVKFVVNEDGSINNIAVLKKDSPGFGKEATRVVGVMPKFKPGTQQGKPVKVQLVLPFQFKLNN